MFKIILEENLLKKVILHNEKYLSLLPEVFLQEKSNYGQVIIYSVFILIVLIIVSLFLIEIDEVVKVQGVVKPEENISIVKNIVSGKILKINYEAGKIVNAGDLLYKIDDSSLISQLETELNFLNQYETELFVYKNILHLLNGKTLEDEDDNLNEEILLKYNSYLSSVNKIKKEIEINENYYNDEILKPINLSSRISIRDKKAKLEYLKLGLAEYQINYKNEINEKIKSYQKLCLESNFKIDSLLLEIEKTNVCSPVDGIIQEIQTFNEGDFIFSSQEILKIVPSIDNLYKVHLYLNPSDIAKIIEGLQVKLRFPAFPFYEYKGLTGKIEKMDSDTTNLSNGNFYKLICNFDDTKLFDKSGNVYEMRSGLEVDARIIVDKKTIIKFLLKKIGLEQ